MKFRLFLGATLLFIIALSSCDKPRVFVESGMLEFSADTVKFDSIFTTFQAPTGRLIAFNNTDNNINISRIWLESGANSEFSLIVDGIRSDDVSDVPLGQGDSAHVFVTFRSELKDMYAEEYINFQIGDQTQKVLIRARVIDAYLIRTLAKDSLGNTFIRGETVITRDTAFPTDKFIVIDGPLLVENGATLTLLPGTSLFFTPRRLEDDDPNFFDFDARLFSLIYVGNGSLKVQGTAADPVVMQGSRFDTLYLENPAQWRGLWFSKDSKDNEIEHALIKNGLVGVRIDSTAFNGRPKVRMRHTEIRNMGAYGVWGLGFDPNGLGNAPQLEMENCVVHNCAERTLLLSGGGNYEFYNCTFGNFSFDFSRRTPQLFAQNYLFDPVQNAIIGQYDLKAHFFNSVVWGTEEEELLLEDLGLSFDVKFDHCLIRTSEDPMRDYDYSPFFFNSLQNQDPLFNDPRLYDYRPRENSPLIDAGLDFSIRYDVDFRDDPLDFPRNDAAFDIGAFEYYPIEE
jgi:hypothetical protein